MAPHDLSTVSTSGMESLSQVCESSGRFRSAMTQDGNGRSSLVRIDHPPYFAFTYTLACVSHLLSSHTLIHLISKIC